MSDAPAPQPGDYLRRTLQRLRAKRGDAPPSAYELALEKGAAGELEFGTALNQAAATRGGCWVLHGLVVDGKRADIDHLVIGPAGVTAIDSKTWTGRVWAGRVGLGRGRRAYPAEIDGMSRQINRVHSRLAQAGRDDVPVAGVLCLVNRNAGIPAAGLTEIRGVKVGHPNAVIHHALRDGRVDTTTIEVVARVLRDAFVVNGGYQAPTYRAPTPVPPLRRRGLHVVRLGRWAVAVVIAALLAVAAVGVGSAIVGSLGTKAHELGRPFRPLSREDLMAREPTYRHLARRRAHDRVHRTKIRTRPAEFVLTYRHGKRCRVVIHVARGAPIVGGGKPTLVRARGCKRRG